MKNDPDETASQQKDELLTVRPLKKILIIFGTRPEVIKTAPVVIELKKHSDVFETVVCATAQHREMLDQSLHIFGINPDLDLDLMEYNQTLPQLTSRVLLQISRVLESEKPDVMLVQGDTTSVMGASLSAFYQQIPVGHIEAGLRTEDRYSPFPEEINRRLTSVLAKYHFAPTPKARDTLLAEGIPTDRIHVTGNTVIDALHLILRSARPKIVEEILELASRLKRRRLILVTAHRRENFGGPFEEVCKGLKGLAERNRDSFVVFPVHLNPNVREPVFRILGDTEGIYLIDPVGYDAMAHLMKESLFIITDSGGIQEEAPSLGKPVLVLRKNTERPEAIEAGVAKIIGPRADAIISEGEKLLHDQKEYEKMARVRNLYGDGKASVRIIDFLMENLPENKDSSRKGNCR